MTRRSTLCMAAILFVATPAAANSYAHFTLGLRAEYLGEEQTVSGTSAELDTLRAAIALAFSGHLIDPRIISFNGFVEQALVDYDRSAANPSDDQSAGDYRNDQTQFSLGLRALSTLPVSLALGARRFNNDFSGPARGALVAGTENSFYGDLFITGIPHVDATLSHFSSDFEADDPETLRDRAQSTTRLIANSGTGLFDARLNARHEELELFSGLQRQELDVGYLDLSYNRGGKNSVQSIFSGNRVRVARDDEDFGDWTTIWKNHTAYTRTWIDRGFLRAFADFQENTGPGGNFTAWVGGLTVVRNLSPTLALDGEASYLRSEGDEGGTIDQPVASVGVRWTYDRAKWLLTLHPRLSFIQISTGGGESESSTGERLFANIRRRIPRGYVGLEGEIAANQLSIASLGPGVGPGGVTFLAGLEKERQRAQLQLGLRPSAQTNLYATAEARRTVRLDQGAEITQETAQANLFFGWRRLGLRFGYSDYSVDGGLLPSTTTVTQGGLTWMPSPWLAVDGRAYTENRAAEGSTGELDWGEIGVRFFYAQLSFYARVREQTSRGDGAQPRDDRRYWIGVQRTFDFHLGGGNGRPTAVGWDQ